MTRLELYEKVWEKPIRDLSGELKISETKIKKLCELYNIPLPKMGYWQKIKYGKQIEKPKLVNRSNNPVIDLSSAEVKSPLRQRTELIELENASNLTVPEKLTKPHQLITRTKQYWASTNKKNLSEIGEKLCIYSITKPNKKRALRFMDALIKLLEVRNHKVVTAKYETLVIVYGIEIEISLREANKRVPTNKSYPTFDLVPTGELILNTNRWSREKQFRDGKIKKIEDMLSRIVAKLEIDAIEELEWKKRAEENRIRREKEEEIKRQQQELIDIENSNLKKLVRDAEKFELANKIRVYITALEKNTNANNEEYIKWCKSKADWIDPLIQKEDLILGDFKATFID